MEVVYSRTLFLKLNSEREFENWAYKIREFDDDSNKSSRFFEIKIPYDDFESEIIFNFSISSNNISDIMFPRIVCGDNATDRFDQIDLIIGWNNYNMDFKKFLKEKIKALGDNIEKK